MLAPMSMMRSHWLRKCAVYGFHCFVSWSSSLHAALNVQSFKTSEPCGGARALEGPALAVAALLAAAMAALVAESAARCILLHALGFCVLCWCLDAERTCAKVATETMTNVILMAMPPCVGARACPALEQGQEQKVKKNATPQNHENRCRNNE